ncbi:Insulin gene enhancer protein ISL-2, partial [Ophiophagus hannah]
MIRLRVRFAKAMGIKGRQAHHANLALDLVAYLTGLSSGKEGEGSSRRLGLRRKKGDTILARRFNTGIENILPPKKQFGVGEVPFCGGWGGFCAPLSRGPPRPPSPPPFSRQPGPLPPLLLSADAVPGRQPSLRPHVHKQAEKTTRVRTVLNEKQLHTLRTCYAANPRPDALMKEQLVEMTGLSPRVIRVWFQNKRCKDKKKSILMKQLQQQQQQHSDKA